MKGYSKSSTVGSIAMQCEIIVKDNAFDKDPQENIPLGNSLCPERPMVTYFIFNNPLVLEKI